MSEASLKPLLISCFIVSKQKPHEVLLIKRLTHPKGTWQMVTGKIESGETAFQAAKREVLEETGLFIEDIYSADCVETFYIPSQDRIRFSVVFFALADREAKITLHPKEHDDFQWLPLNKALSLLSFQQQKKALQTVSSLLESFPPSPFLSCPS